MCSITRTRERGSRSGCRRKNHLTQRPEKAGTALQQRLLMQYSDKQVPKDSSISLLPAVHAP